MASDPIDEFIALPQDQQLSTLGQLSPEKQTKLLDKVRTRRSQTQALKNVSRITEFEKSNQPPPQTLGRFLSSAITPIVGAAKGLYQAADATPRNDEEKKWLSVTGPGGLFLKRVLADPAQAEFTQARDLASKGEYSKAIGHGVAAALPLVGPAAAEFAETSTEQAGKGDVVGALGTLTGNVAMIEAPKLAVKGVNAIQNIPSKTGPAIRSLTGTSPKVVEELAKKTGEENVKQAEGRAVDLKKHFEKTQAAQKANVEAEAPAARKTALNRGVERLDTEFQGDLKATEKNVHTQADTKYNAVRTATKGKTIPPAELANAVKGAEGKIQGSSENLKIFRDILSKYPESDPDFIEYQGAQIPKTNRLYDILKEQGEGATKPAEFADLQGYYTETGNLLAKGNLPGDVYQAMKYLHESIGKMMQKMADGSGVGPQLADAQQFYHGYMSTFRDSNSPIYKAIKATERGQSIRALAGKDQTGIEALAKYNPELARRANTVRGYQAEAKAIPAKTPKLKSLPKLSEKPSPKTLNTEDIQGAKEKSLKKRADAIRYYTMRAAVYVTGYRSLVAISRAMLGDVKTLEQLPPDIVEGIAVAGGGNALANFLESPQVVKLLTSPTAEDIAKIPSEMRGDIGPIVQQAQRQGIKVSPLLLRAIGPTGVGAALTPAGQGGDQSRP